MGFGCKLVVLVLCAVLVADSTKLYVKEREIFVVQGNFLIFDV